jgi:hypothetical protein
MSSAAGASRGAIGTATAIALAVAAVVLFTVVLPAEYGVDPLGTGRRFGLTEVFSARPPDIAPAAGGPVHAQPAGYRVDSRQLVVPSLTSVEFKYTLQQGAAFIYSWKATYPVEFDFHTEPAGRAPEASESFERGEASEAHGFYTAPYDGIHGWYWENLTDQDVTISLDAAGFFSEATLFPLNAPPQHIGIPARR